MSWQQASQPPAANALFAGSGGFQGQGQAQSPSPSQSNFASFPPMQQQQAQHQQAPQQGAQGGSFSPVQQQVQPQQGGTFNTSMFSAPVHSAPRTMGGRGPSSGSQSSFSHAQSPPAMNRSTAASYHNNGAFRAASSPPMHSNFQQASSLPAASGFAAGGFSQTSQYSDGGGGFSQSPNSHQAPTSGGYSQSQFFSNQGAIGGGGGFSSQQQQPQPPTSGGFAQQQQVSHQNSMGGGFVQQQQPQLTHQTSMSGGFGQQQQQPRQDQQQLRQSMPSTGFTQSQSQPQTQVAHQNSVGGGFVQQSQPQQYAPPPTSGGFVQSPQQSYQPLANPGAAQQLQPQQSQPPPPTSGGFAPQPQPTQQHQPQQLPPVSGGFAQQQNQQSQGFNQSQPAGGLAQASPRQSQPQQPQPPQQQLEDPALMAAIARSTNADVIALRNLLESDKKKAAIMLQEKRAAVEEWKAMHGNLTATKSDLLSKIAEAKAERERLTKELETTRSTNAAVEAKLSAVAMEELRKEHLATLAMLRNVAEEGDKTARPELIGSVAGLIGEALSQLSQASQKGGSVTMELMDLQRRMRAYLSYVRGIAFNCNDPELARRITEAGERAAASDEFLRAIADPSPANIAALMAAIKAGVADVDAVCKQMAETEEKTEAQEDEKLQDEAEQQLREAAKAIELAAQSIAAIRNKPMPQDFGLGAVKVSEALLAGTEELALITGRLVHHATLAQKERKAKESDGVDGEEARQLYRENQTWVNGLISAAQSAAYRITLLVQIANNVVQKDQSWEYIIAGSEEVQMAGVQLVTAARAKLDNMSVNRRNLEGTQSEMSGAVKKLVVAANAFYEELEPPQVKTEDLSSTKAHTAVHQHKSDVESLEVKLKQEQMQLLELLTQASGGRTEDSRKASNVALEPVNRGLEPVPAMHALPAGAVSPRHNPFQTSADRAAHVRSVVPSSAMFEARPAAASPPRAPIVVPVKTAPLAKIAARAPVKAPVAAVAPVKIALPVAAPAVPAPAPAKFNPFGAVGPKKAMVKRGPVPPPPAGANPNAGRPVPPPPK